MGVTPDSRVAVVRLVVDEGVHTEGEMGPAAVVGAGRSIG